MLIHLPQGDLQDLGGFLCKGLSSILVSQNQIHRCRGFDSSKAGLLGFGTPAQDFLLQAFDFFSKASWDDRFILLDCSLSDLGWYSVVCIMAPSTNHEGCAQKK